MDKTFLSGNAEASATPKFTAKEKRDELARECNLRNSVYPGQVRQGRMRQDQADRQKAIMYAIWKDYCAIVDGEAPEPQPQQPLALDQPTEPCAAEDVIAGRGVMGAPTGRGVMGEPSKASTDDGDQPEQAEQKHKSIVVTDSIVALGGGDGEKSQTVHVETPAKETPTETPPKSE